MSKPLISFIIPCHNNEKTLEKAVCSLVSEAHAKEIEIIIVENASTDQTYQRALNLREKNKYNNILLFQSEKGVSNARNCGIEHASGRYISFVDADDSINKKEIDVLIADAKTDRSDLYCYGHIAGDEKRPVSQQRQFFSKEQIESIKAQMIANPTKYMQAWGKLFRASLVKENDVRFNKRLSFAEDSDFTLNYLRFIQSICLCPELVYDYTLNPNSVMRTFSGDKTKKYIDALYSTQRLINHESIQIKKAYNYYILMHFNIMMVREVYSLNNPDTCDSKIKTMKGILADPIFTHAIRQVKLRKCFSPRMLPFLLIKMKQYRLASQIYSIRARQNWKKENRQ
ncbi:glycosyltransferase family 2 protein [uncultured Pseudoramibacter sp.]|uniref:glycosyltransferase family 2 protein n=1 Tax=uncultured Pseudoramibacter sp. TaxID=1623493 RepID=UPI0025E39FBB|nr:glycosyltransferase family 2 protein [uncultured Pseudoramibacter sp.]